MAVYIDRNPVHCDDRQNVDNEDNVADEAGDDDDYFGQLVVLTVVLVTFVPNWNKSVLIDGRNSLHHQRQN